MVSPSGAPFDAPFSDAFQRQEVSAFNVAPALGSITVDVGRGWLTDGAENQPSVMLCDRDGLPLTVLPILSMQASEQLSQSNEATIVLGLGGTEYPDVVRRMLEPWASTIVVLVGEVPVWGGTVVKRRTDLGRTAMELACREWSTWLDRVWTTAAIEYSPVLLEDAGRVIKDRIDKAVTLAPASVRPPLGNVQWSGPAGVEADVEFLDQTDEPNPQTILNEVETVAQLGIEWQMPWRVTSDGRYVPTLVTQKFNPDANTKELMVGTDCASATMEVDSDGQANVVRVVGADGDIAVAATPTTGLPLWRSFSYEKVGENAATVDEAVAQVQALADSLLKQVRDPLLTATNITLPGLTTRFRVGDLVDVVVPSDYDPRFPNGTTARMRCVQVQWEASATSRTTQLQMASPFESIPNPQRAPQETAMSALTPRSLPDVMPNGREGFEPALRHLFSRVESLELRRSATIWQAQQAGVPVGTIVAFGGNFIPPGWLQCHGMLIPEEYTDLRALVGTHTPDLTDKFIKAAGPGVPVNSQGGTTTVPLPQHSHGMDAAGRHNHSAWSGLADRDLSHNHLTGLSFPEYTLPKWTSGDSFTHQWAVSNWGTGGYTGYTNGPNHGHGIGIGEAEGHEHGIHNAGTAGATMEPRFWALLYIIKAVA